MSIFQLSSLLLVVYATPLAKATFDLCCSHSPSEFSIHYVTGLMDKEHACVQCLRNKVTPAHQLNRVDVLVGKYPSDTDADSDRDDHWHD
jgi:hypothetical protein